MSAFTCINGHHNPAGTTRCEVCGDPVLYTDGLSAGELARIEAINDDEAEE